MQSLENCCCYNFLLCVFTQSITCNMFTFWQLLREGQYKYQRLSEWPQDKISSTFIQMYTSLLSINGTEQLLPTGTF